MLKENTFNFDLHDILTETVEMHFLDKTDEAEEIAVARLIVIKGYEVLTPRQSGIFLHSAVPAMKACVGELRVRRMLEGLCP